MLSAKYRAGEHPRHGFSRCNSKTGASFWRLLFAQYYLAAFSFFVFFVAVVTKTMNYATYVTCGLIRADVHCFAAVFAPTRLPKTLYHEWRNYDEDLRKWITTDRMPYEIEGLRDQGYRWYSRKRNVWPGKWMVDIRTAEGRTLGRVRFSVESAAPGIRMFEAIRYE